MNKSKISVLIITIIILLINTGCINNARKLTDEGNKLYLYGDDEKAISCFNAALEIEPHSIYTLNSKGKVLYYQARYDEAMECCNKVLTLEPSSKEAENLKYEIYKVLFKKAKDHIYNQIIISFATCKGYIKEWELSAHVKITEKTIKNLPQRIDISKLKPLIARGFREKELKEKLNSIGFTEVEIEAILEHGETFIEDESINNPQVKKLYKELKEKNLIEDLIKGEKEIDYLMVKIKNPPAEYEEAYKLMTKFYEYYKEVLALAIKPSDHYRLYMEKVIVLDGKSLPLYNKLKEKMPEK